MLVYGYLGSSEYVLIGNVYVFVHGMGMVQYLRWEVLEVVRGVHRIAMIGHSSCAVSHFGRLCSVHLVGAVGSEYVCKRHRRAGGAMRASTPHVGWRSGLGRGPG